MTVQELIIALAQADPTWDVSMEYEDLSGWGPGGTRIEDQYLATVHVGANDIEGVALRTSAASRASA